MGENVDNILRDVRRELLRELKIRQMEFGAMVMIEAMKADRLIPDGIDTEKVAKEAIRRHNDPMLAPIPIVGMVED